MNPNRPTDCFRCGGELEQDQQLERPVRAGNDVAIVKVTADVCSKCGEVLLHPGMANRLLQAKRRLESGPSAPAVGQVKGSVENGDGALDPEGP